MRTMTVWLNGVLVFNWIYYIWYMEKLTNYTMKNTQSLHSLNASTGNIIANAIKWYKQIHTHLLILIFRININRQTKEETFKAFCHKKCVSLNTIFIYFFSCFRINKANALKLLFEFEKVRYLPELKIRIKLIS